jgi:hypothetical protein
VVELDVDGECPGKLPARFELMPSAMWMVVPGLPAEPGGLHVRPGA